MRARRTDGNHAATLEALRKLGYVCKSLHTQGGGVEDILVGVRRDEKRYVHTGDHYVVEHSFWVLLEMKRPRNKRAEVVPSQLTPAQLAWHEQTQGFPRIVATSAKDAVQQLRLLP